MKKGWPVTRLGDLTDLVTKGTTPTSIGHEFVGDGINFVKVESISTTGEFIEEKFAHITPACHAVLGRSQLQAGDILFSIAGALGRTGFVTDEILPANTNQALAIIRLKRDVGLSPKFVLKALETGVVLEQIEKFKGGVAQQNLSLAQVRDFQIALPPLAEQQRIVGLLDEAFEGLATAKANAEKNLQNARALFESHLQSVFTQRGPGWVEKTIGETCTLRSGTTVSPTLEKPIGDIPYLKVADMTFDGNEDQITTSSRFLSDTDVRVSAIIPKGATIFPKRGGAILTNKKRITSLPICADLNIMAVIPSSQIDAGLLYFYFLNVDMRKLGTGSSIPQINNYDVAPLLISFPKSLATQEEIVSKLDDLREETQRLARLYERKQAALEALKKSLLHQAFTGEL